MQLDSTRNRLTYRLLFTAAILLGCLVQAGAMTPEEAFVGAPYEVVATIDSLTRLDMLDYYHSGSTRASKNVFLGDSRVVSSDSSTIVVETSPVQRLTITLLPAEKADTLLMVCTTLAAPAPDSFITFYAADWTQLPAEPLMKRARLTDWLTPEGRKNRAEVERNVDFITAESSYNPTTQTLTIRNTLSQTLGTEEWNRVKTYLRPSLSYRWDGRRFKEIKAAP